MTSPIFPGQVHVVQPDLGFLCSMSRSVHPHSLTAKKQKSILSMTLVISGQGIEPLLYICL